MFRPLVTGRLFVGNARDARSLEGIANHEISAMVDLAAEEPPATPFRETLLTRIPLTDDSYNREGHLELAITTVLQFLSLGEVTLVSCSAGQSRSPVIAMAACSLWENSSFEAATERWIDVAETSFTPAFYEHVLRVIRRMPPRNFLKPDISG